MKVLHVLAQLPSKTGSGVYFSNVIKGLKESENACIYGCFPEFDNSTVPGQHQYLVVFPNADCDFPLPGMSDVMPYRSTVYGEMTPTMIANWRRAFTATIKQALAEFQPDVILCHHLWFLTSLVCQLATVPVYAFCHGTDLRQANQHPALKDRYVTNLDRLQQIFALSHLEKQRIQAVYGLPADKITVIGGGYDPAIFNPQGREAHTNIEVVYAGKIAAAKGVFALMPVFDRLSKKYPQARLTLVGNVGPVAKQRLAPYLQNPQIHLRPAVPQRQLADLYRHSDIFVLPSYYEGLALSAIEALACDLRVVITTIPALQEQLGPLVNNSGLISYVDLPRIVNQDEPVKADLPAFYDRLQAALEKQLTAVKEGQPFPTAVRTAIQSNSWPRLIQRIQQIIESK